MDINLLNLLSILSIIFFILFAIYFLKNKKKNALILGFQQQLQFLHDDINYTIKYIDDITIKKFLKNYQTHIKYIQSYPNPIKQDIDLVSTIQNIIKIRHQYSNSSIKAISINISPALDIKVGLEQHFFYFLIKQLICNLNTNEKYIFNLEIVHSEKSPQLYISIFDYVTNKIDLKMYKNIKESTQIITYYLHGNIEFSDSNQLLITLPFESSKCKNDFKLPALKAYVLSNKNSDLMDVLHKNKINFKHFRSTSQAYKVINRSLEKDCDLIIIDNSSLKDHDSIQFSKIIKDSPLENKPLILIASTQAITNFDLIKKEYFTVLDYDNISENLSKMIFLASKIQDVKSTKQLTVLPKKKSILIADDDPNTLRVLTASFESLNYFVIQADNGMTAVQLLKKNPMIDYAILDQSMPYHNGLDVVKIHQLDNSSSNVIFVISSCDEYQLIKEQCSLFKNAYFLKKPVFTKDFFSLIENITLELLIDEKVIERITETFKNDTNALSMMVQSFETHVTESFQKLKSLDPSDTINFSKGIHSISSSASNIGCVQIIKQCEHLKSSLNAEITDNSIENHLNKLDDTITQTVIKLKSKII